MEDESSKLRFLHWFRSDVPHAVVSPAEVFWPIVAAETSHLPSTRTVYLRLAGGEGLVEDR